MEHNQARREAYYKELDSMSVEEMATKKMKTKDCECFSCLEEMRCLIADSMKYEFGQTDEQIQAYMNPTTMPWLFTA